MTLVPGTQDAGVRGLFELMCLRLVGTTPQHYLNYNSK